MPPIPTTLALGVALMLYIRIWRAALLVDVCWPFSAQFGRCATWMDFALSLISSRPKKEKKNLEFCPAPLVTRTRDGSPRDGIYQRIQNNTQYPKFVERRLACRCLLPVFSTVWALHHLDGFCLVPDLVTLEFCHAFYQRIQNNTQCIKFVVERCLKSAYYWRRG